MPSTSFKKSWVLCISGATNALERVDLALDSKEADAKVIRPLIEAPWWVCAADESLMKEYPAQWRDNLTEHRKVLGITGQVVYLPARSGN